MNSAEGIVCAFQKSIEDIEAPARTDNDILNIIGLGLIEAVQALYPGTDEAFCDILSERYRHHYVENNTIESHMFDGAESLLQELNERDYLLALATGKARRGLKRVFEDTGMDKYFHSSRCADECFSKPHPQMVEELMDQFGCTPDRTLMIGDTEYDLQMAKNAGAHGLGVSYGVHGLERLQQCEPLDCVHSLEELTRWLRQNA